MYRLNTVAEFLSDPEDVQAFLRERGADGIVAGIRGLRVLVFEETDQVIGASQDWFVCTESDLEPFVALPEKGDIVLRRLGENGADIVGLYQIFDNGYEMYDVIQDLYSTLEVLARHREANAGEMMDVRDSLDHAVGYLSSLRAFFCDSVEEKHIAEIRDLMAVVESHTEKKSDNRPAPSPAGIGSATAAEKQRQAEWARPYLEEGVLAYLEGNEVRSHCLRKVTMRDTGVANFHAVDNDSVSDYALAASRLEDGSWKPAKPLTRYDAFRIATHKARGSLIRDVTDYFVPITGVVECSDGSGYLLMDSPEGLFYEKVDADRFKLNTSRAWLLLQAGAGSTTYNDRSPTGSYIFSALKEGAVPISEEEKALQDTAR